MGEVLPLWAGVAERPREPAGGRIEGRIVGTRFPVGAPGRGRPDISSNQEMFGRGILVLWVVMAFGVEVPQQESTRP